MDQRQQSGRLTYDPDLRRMVTTPASTVGSTPAKPREVPAQPPALRPAQPRPTQFTKPAMPVNAQPKPQPVSSPSFTVKKTPWWHHKLIWLIPLGLLAFGVIGGGVFWWLNQQAGVIPNNIASQAGYSLFHPDDSQTVFVDRSTYRYDQANGLLSYQTTYESKEVIFSMQAVPSEFTEVAGTFDKYIEGLNPVLSFDTTIGTVNVTEPDNLDKDQAAIMKEKGTLLFVRVIGKLDESQWRRLFQHIEVVKQ